MFGTYRRVHKNGMVVWVDIEAQALRARVPPGVTDPAPFLSNVGVAVVERVRRPLGKVPPPVAATFGITTDVQVRQHKHRRPGGGAGRAVALSMAGGVGARHTFKQLVGVWESFHSLPACVCRRCRVLSRA